MPGADPDARRARRRDPATNLALLREVAALTATLRDPPPTFRIPDAAGWVLATDRTYGWTSGAEALPGDLDVSWLLTPAGELWKIVAERDEDEPAYVLVFGQDGGGEPPAADDDRPYTVVDDFAERMGMTPPG